jgi:hypothetical protein
VVELPVCPGLPLVVSGRGLLGRGSGGGGEGVGEGAAEQFVQSGCPGPGAWQVVDLAVRGVREFIVVGRRRRTGGGGGSRPA